MYKRRCLSLFIIFISCFILIYIKIIKLQCTDAPKLSVLADSQYQYTEKTQELNYKLLDCNGKNLIDYKREFKAVIIPQTFAKNNMKLDNGMSLKVLETLRKYNDEYDIMQKKHWTSNAKVVFNIDYDTYEKLKNIKGVKGFYTFCYFKVNRNNAWSVENMLTSIKRLNNNEKKDDNSLEVKLHNKLSNNKQYKIDFKVDIDGNIKECINQGYLKNKNVRLTLDKDLQYGIKSMLNKKYKKYNQIGVIVMEADTGKIKVMVQKNDKLPNVNIGAETLNGFFPGSIFKTVVLEGELEKNCFASNKKFKCSGLYEDSENNRSHGKLNIEDAFVVSCNHIYSQIGKDVGFDNIHKLIVKQELFNKILGFDKEQHGKLQVNNPKWEDGTLSLTSIGQNMRMTPIEAISIVNTIANHGTYIRPYIIDAYVDANNEEEVIYTDKWRVISKETANKVKEAMRKVVNYGTGRMVKLEGVDIGGKTGSTERIEVAENKQGTKKFSDGWFIGFFKDKGKIYSAVVFVKDIDKNYESGGTTAGPIFKEVVKILKK